MTFQLTWLSICAALLACAQCSRAAEARAIRFGHFPNVTHAQALYARADGAMERKLGVPIRWSIFNAGPTAIEAMFADAIDLTFVGPNPAINGFIRSKGEKFVIIAGAASGGSGLVVRKDAGITTENDFKGKTIASPQLGNTQDVAARMWFDEHGYKLREKGGTLTLIPLSNPDQLLLFQKKQIDGAWTVEPWLSRLELEGDGKLFLDERTLWPSGHYVTTHLIVNRDFLAQNPNLIKKILEGLVDVTQQINSNKTAAATVLNGELKKTTGKSLPEAVLARALERVEFTWDPLAASLRHCAESAHKVGFTRTKPDLTGIYWLRPLNEVLKQKGLPPVRD